ncbi:MAG: ArsR family transcriptional regulator [Actinomycetes bacterium]
MRNKPPSLVPLLRSNRMAHALAVLYLHPGQEYSLSDLAQVIGTTPSALHRDIGYLTESGFVIERTDGRSRKLSARTDHPLTDPLRQLVVSAFGPPAVLAEELNGVEGIDEQLIFGSWAARYQGEPGRFPGDIDVLIVGNPKRATVHEATASAAARLNLEVNATVVSPDRWQTSDDPLMASIKSRPVVVIEGVAARTTVHGQPPPDAITDSEENSE